MSADQAVAPDVDWLSQWLAAEGQDADGPLEVTRIGHGYSNLTFRLADRAGHSWVLRRPPPGQLLASAHDVVREARIMAALDRTVVAVPTVRPVREDGAGVPWVLMEHVHGEVVDSVAAGRRVSDAARRTIGSSMARSLATIHSVDIDAVGLGDLASRAPYAPRQLRRWTRQWEQTQTQPFDALDRLTARLHEAVPERQEIGLVHGDFHIRDVIVRGGDVAAVLDWELSTLGDPLADLGTLLAYWPHPGELAAGDQTSPTTLPGWPTRDALLSEYAAASDRDLSGIGFWHVLGLWKIAIIGQGVVRRAAEQPDARSLGRLPTHADIASLVEYAHRIADDWSL